MKDNRQDRATGESKEYSAFDAVLVNKEGKPVFGFNMVKEEDLMKYTKNASETDNGSIKE